MREWIKRLRSGDRTQGRGSLHTEIVGEHRYCCLGVGAEIAAERGITASEQIAMPIQDGDTRIATIVHSYAGSIATMTPIIRNHFGIDAPTMYRLVYLNDTAKRTLCEIADFLEQEFFSDDDTGNPPGPARNDGAQSVGPRPAEAVR